MREFRFFIAFRINSKYVCSQLHYMVFCRRNRKATEQAILNAAAKLFSEKGYDSTRTLEIAKEAGANEALIARYFGGKEGLLTAILSNETTSQALILSDKVACCLEKFQKKKPGVDFVSAVKAYFKSGKEEIEEKEQFMRIAMSRSLVDREMAKLVQEKIIDQQLPVLIDSLKDHLDESGVNQKQVEAIAMLLAASNHTFNFLGRKVHGMDDKKVDFALQVLTDSLSLYLESQGKRS